MTDYIKEGYYNTLRLLDKGILDYNQAFEVIGDYLGFDPIYASDEFILKDFFDRISSLPDDKLDLYLKREYLITRKELVDNNLNKLNYIKRLHK